MSTFDTLGLDAPLIQAIQDLGFTKPSEVQQKAIPILLGEETDLVALAQTGTGKTAAFGFPLIQKIDPSRKHTQGLILSPTRELCLQITNEIKLYAKYIPGLHTVAIYGGASITEQASQIKRGAQIVVATPGRMKDMINRGLINITQIDYCILDEADEMLHMTSKIKHSGKMYLMKISIVYLLVCCVVFILGLLFILGLFFYGSIRIIFSLDTMREVHGIVEKTYRVSIPCKLNHPAV